MDFAALPPEVNSARMYAGAGAAPLRDAAAAWDNLAAELTAAATETRSTVMALAAAWIGPSATAMSTAVSTYISWLTTTAEHAAQTAVQAQAAVEAYSAAYAATVPPAMVTANRTRLATLVATNVLGINTAAIATTETAYAEMWAQDAAAMYTYQAESAAATSALPQFSAAPQVTNPLLQFLQTLIPGYTVGQPLQNLALLLTSPLSTAFISSAPTTNVTSVLALLTGLWGIQAAASYGMVPGAPGGDGGSASIEIPPVITPEMPPAKLPEIRAGIGDRIGGLSVPPSWARPVEAPAPRITVAAPGGRSQMGIPVPPAIPVATAWRSSQGRVRADPEYGHVSTVIKRHPWGG